MRSVYIIVYESENKDQNTTLATRITTLKYQNTTLANSLVNPIPPFDPDAEIGTNLAPKWKIWIEDFQMYLVASGITDKKKQPALLLYQAGPRVREIFR